jgi:hypothetical protein
VDEAALQPYNPQPYGDVYVMRADGSDVRQLTDNQIDEVELVLSSAPVNKPARPHDLGVRASCSRLTGRPSPGGEANMCARVVSRCRERKDAQNHPPVVAIIERYRAR